jgi:hypothetical protein
MPGGIAPRGFCPQVQAPQRKHFRSREIPCPVLVVYGEGLKRFARDMTRARRGIEHGTPPRRRGLVAALTTGAERERAKCLNSDEGQRGTAACS